MRLSALVNWFIDWLERNQFADRKDAGFPSTRIAVRIRRDGRTESVPVEEPSLRTILIAALAGLALFLLALTLKNNVGQSVSNFSMPSILVG